jgi:catechol 2,3-dioxygenase-like lactoylglutathione lyase family enzyme
MRRLLPFLFLLAGFSASAQGHGTLAPDLLSIIAKDGAATASWYRTHLGFATFKEMSLPERDSLRIIFLKKDSFMLEIVSKKTVFSVKDREPAYRAFDDPRLSGYNKISFRVQDIAALEARLKKAGVTIHLPLIEDKGFGLRTFIAADPEGNLVQFVEYFRTSGS